MQSDSLDSRRRETLCKAAEQIVERQLAGSTIGASVFTSRGDVFAGVYLRGSTCHTSFHAEAVAIVQALASGPAEILALALYSAKADDRHRLVPCGTCLQLLSEHAGGTRVPILIGTSAAPEWTETTLDALLPRPWVPAPGARAIER